MRATVSFEIDAARVPETMRCLVLEEAHRLHGVIEELEAASVEHLSRDIAAVTAQLQAALHQLHQYQEMLVGFATAEEPPPLRGEQVHSLGEVQDSLSRMSQLDEFLSRINEEEQSDDTEEG